MSRRLGLGALSITAAAALSVVPSSDARPVVGPAVRASAYLSPAVHAAGPDERDAVPQTRRASGAPGKLKRIDAVLRLAGKEVAGYERTGREMKRWFRCINPVAVDQVGDLQHRWGFEYDEKDGTGLDTRPALVLHRGPGRPDLLVLRRTRSPRCLSSAPDPNGTGEDARAALRRRTRQQLAVPAHTRQGGRTSLGALEQRMERLDIRIDRVEGKFDRFDEWESCLSWLPVTELGHEDQGLGYVYDASDASSGHVAAVDIDASEWDDPDYELLTFLGTDRPFTKVECENEPGESVDRGTGTLAGSRPRSGPATSGRASSVIDRLKDLRRDAMGAMEDVEDLVEPVQEFVQFDECMYTVGMQSRGGTTSGYRFVGPDGVLSHRSALSFDMRGFELPQYDVMAFSGEEPPQIECNEDAGGVNTDE